MADFGELDLDGEFRFTVAGREFVVPPVDWPTYLELRTLNDRAAAAALKGDESETFPQFYEVAEKVLGPVFAELIAAKVPGPKISFAARSAFYHQIGESTLAQLYWADAEGKAPASGSTSTTRTGSTSSGKAKSTRRRGSTTPTTSRTKSTKRSGPTKAAATV